MKIAKSARATFRMRERPELEGKVKEESPEGKSEIWSGKYIASRQGPGNLSSFEEKIDKGPGSKPERPGRLRTEHFRDRE